MKNLKPVTLGAGAFLYSLLAMNIAMADDTEIYVPKDLPADQYVRPNILFVLDSSGSMGSTVAGTGGLSRNQVLKNVVNNLIDEIKVKEDVNVGFMRYDGNDGGYILSPTQRLTNNNAASMKAVVNAIPASGNTPLLETYYESYLYMTGKNRFWGDKSVASSLKGDTYISPIEHSCQKSHIIYVTDGEPTQDTSSNATVKTLVTGKNTLYPASSCGNGQGQCLPHLAEYMANQDLAPAPTNFADPTGRKQTVTSHFVGFTVNLPLLKNAASAGGGSYYTSNNVSGLTDALKAIIVDITADNTSFAAPSVAVSAYNNLGYRNALYYALFRPAEGARWPGNVKRYKLAEDTNGNPLIVDKNGDPAIDDSTGFFSKNSSSFWSTVDGNDVAKGGVAEQLISPATRNVLTWTGTDRTPTAGAGVSGTASLETFETGTSNLTATLLGASTPAERTRYIDWARGYTINPDGTTNTTAPGRQSVADVLHNEPRLIAYTTDEDLVRADTTNSKEQLYMFFGDNEGFIHAIDPVVGTGKGNGIEKFAFIPKELLANPGAYYRDAKGSANKRYGMDGLINVWTEYDPVDTVNKTRSISKAYLYAGMRRGGSNYYSLDVKDINTPKLKWILKGPEQAVQGNGTVVNATSGFTPGYAKLGRTFSAPSLASIKINGTKTKVLIFSGGYDLDQDYIGDNTRKTDDIGNSLYISDADTGKLLWSASNTGADLNLAAMNHSMPASPAVIDVNRDGLADIIYTADLGGQVFRFDIDPNNTGANNLATGGLIASLGGATAQENRRFFTTPDVAFIQERGSKPYFTISLGSGFRESPLNVDTNDRFYVLRDQDVYAKPSTYQTITEGDLVDVSGVNLTTAQSTQVLADIKVLENQMKALNTDLSNAQDNFRSYKAGIGYTGKVDTSISTYNAANDKQRQLDALTLANGPYLADHAPESLAQSKLQDALTRARDVLASIEQARANAQALANATDATALAAAATVAATALSNAQTAYTSAQTAAANDATTAASKSATAQASENAAAAALNNYNDAVAAKTDADNALAVANTTAANALTVRNNALTALSAANATVATTQSAANAAASQLTTATIAASSAQTAVNTAVANLDAANTDLGLKQGNLTTADNALQAAQDALDADILANGPPGAPALITARNDAQTARNTANTAVTAATANVASKQSAKDAADTGLLAATAAAATAQATKDNADADLATANANAGIALTDKNNAESTLTAANADVVAKQGLQATAASNLTATTNTRNSTAATATTDRAASDAAAATAASSAANAASKLTTQNAAQAAKTAADLATTNAVADDSAAVAMTAQRDRMAANYETLIKLQSSLDTANAGIIAQENAIITAKADSGFDANLLPAMEAALTGARAAYAAMTDYAQRTALNVGSPSAAVKLLNDVSAALAAGNAAAVAAALNTALATLEGSLGTPGPLTGTTSQLLARDEASKQAALKSLSDSEQGAGSLIATLTAQRDALTAQADTLKSEAETLEIKPYDPATSLLTTAQFNAVNASGLYSNPLTTFDAYQYLIDLALIAANDPTSGLPALRKQINDKYAQLTPGDSYTANADLLAAAKGFYLRLVKGEKVLSSSVSFRKAVLFSTFSPRGQTVSTCGADVGRGKTYALSLIDASAVFAVSVNGVATPTRSFELKRSGIPPTPSVILTENKPVFLTGTETLEFSECIKGNEGLCSTPIESTYWRED